MHKPVLLLGRTERVGGQGNRHRDSPSAYLGHHDRLVSRGSEWQGREVDGRSSDWKDRRHSDYDSGHDPIFPFVNKESDVSPSQSSRVEVP